MPHEVVSVWGNHIASAHESTLQPTNLLDQVLCPGKLDELDRVLEDRYAAPGFTPDGDPFLALTIRFLDSGYRVRFAHLGVLADLDKAIKWQSRLITILPNGHPRLNLTALDMIAELESSYEARFKRLGEVGDIEKLIECGSHALTLTPDGGPQSPSVLANLGTSYHRRFERLGDLADVENAIGYLSRALPLAANSRELFPHCLNHLGASHASRFEHLGEMTDLEKAIEYGSHALALTPDNHPLLPHFLINLGTFYASRFHRLGEMNDLEKAIEFEACAVEVTPDGDQNLPQMLSNLGASLADRFRHSKDPEDLNQSIENSSRALSLTPNDHPFLPFQLLNLGMNYRDRFIHLGEEPDIKDAIKYALRGIDLVPEGHPQLPRFHDTLAHLRFLHATRTTDPNGPYLLFQASNSLRIASRSVLGKPRERFTAVLRWTGFASVPGFPDWIEAFQTAIDLLPQFIWLGGTTHQRYQDLDRAKGLAVSAASTAISHSEYGLALEWLENARCVVWSQNVMLRSPLDELASSHPTIATRLQTVAQQLHQSNVDSEPRARVSRRFSSDMTDLRLEQAVQQHHRLAEEYSTLLAKVRELPGLDNFLRPMKASGLMSVARHGPIVVLTYFDNRCDALVVLPGENRVKHIPLPGFNLEKAGRAHSELDRLVRNGVLRERGERRPVLEPEDDFGNMLAILWYDIVKPILDSLGYMNNQDCGQDRAQRITRHWWGHSFQEVFSTVLQGGNFDWYRRISKFLKRESAGLGVKEECGESIPCLPHITWCPTGALSFLPLHAAGDYDQLGSRVFDYVVSSYTPTLTSLLSSTPYSLGPDSRVLAIGQEATPGHSPLPGTAHELGLVQAHLQDTVQYTQLVDSGATITAALDAMDQHDWVHLACHAHQDVADPTQSGFFLHDGVLDLAAINRRSFGRKGLAYLSACQTAKGDKVLPDEAIHLASGMLMAGYTSVVATMWSVHDDDAPLVADKVYAQLMKDKTLGNGEAGRALHQAVAELREKVGEREFKRWVPYIHIGS